MSLRRNLTTGEIRDIPDEQIAAWLANGNPKGAHYSTQWEPYTPPEPEPPGPPEQVTKRQLLHWLEFDHGIANPEVAVVEAINAHVPEQMRAFALKDWNRTNYIRFSHQVVPLLAAALQIADVGAAFREMEEKYG